MPRKLDPKIIRVGDTVKIINPQFFVRCGYQLSFEEACEEVKEEYGNRIEKFLQSFNFIATPRWKDIVSRENKYSQVFDKVVAILAYSYTKAKKFGGNERKIFTKDLPDYKDKKMRVKT